MEKKKIMVVEDERIVARDPTRREIKLLKNLMPGCALIIAFKKDSRGFSKE